MGALLLLDEDRSEDKDGPARSNGSARSMTSNLKGVHCPVLVVRLDPVLFPAPTSSFMYFVRTVWLCIRTQRAKESLNVRQDVMDRALDVFCEGFETTASGEETNVAQAWR